MNLRGLTIHLHAPQQSDETLAGTRWIVEGIAGNHQRVDLPLFARQLSALGSNFLEKVARQFENCGVDFVAQCRAKIRIALRTDDA
jgi:hypothetical protein